MSFVGPLRAMTNETVTFSPREKRLKTRFHVAAEC